MKKFARAIPFAAIALALLITLTGCGTSFIPGDFFGTSTQDGAQSQAEGSLTDGKWPASVYSKYGISELPTNGKIVFTQLHPSSETDTYQYEVYFDGVTREELVAWMNSMLDKGMRISDADKERIESSTWNYDCMMYAAAEKQPFRMRIGFDFGNPMTMEYYDENDYNYTVIHEKDEDGEEYSYIKYNVIVSLNPMKTATDFSTEFPSLGLKAEDLKLNDNVRAVVMGEASYMSSISIQFYIDHVATEEEFNGCRELLIDKLGEKGAKFYVNLGTQEATAQETKEGGYGSYYFELNGKKYLLMVDGDSTYNDFGSYYKVIISAQG
ncbi:MAG: hypothetical protein ILO68_04800 [Clostridia bacterium]|nr:hypothetical protein [Clostridia bacterium]